MALWSENRFELVIGPELFAELVDVLNRPKLKAHVDAQRKLSLFRRLGQEAIWTTGAVNAKGMLVNPADDFLMAAALETNAEFVVTWDASLIAQKTCQGVQIVSPDQFISLVVRTR